MTKQFYELGGIIPGTRYHPLALAHDTNLPGTASMLQQFSQDYETDNQLNTQLQLVYQVRQYAQQLKKYQTALAGTAVLDLYVPVSNSQQYSSSSRAAGQQFA